MRETTAEIWIGQSQGSEFIGTKGGINATHLLLLRENSRPAWMMMAGNLHDRKPPVLGRPKVWVPTSNHPTEDALLLFAILGAKDRGITEVFNRFEKSRTRNHLDLDHSFAKGLPKEVYAACRQHLSGWHVIVSVGSYSLAKRDLSMLKKYKELDIEIRETTRGYSNAGE
jgi:hypothetical protein